MSEINIKDIINKSKSNDYNRKDVDMVARLAIAEQTEALVAVNTRIAEALEGIIVMNSDGEGALAIAIKENRNA